MSQHTEIKVKKPNIKAPIRIGIDVGGTFTDVVLEAGDMRTSAKVLTTPQAPERGVIDGLRGALRKARCVPGDVSLVLHGTTLATNAVLERRGARTAFVTTAGFRDILEVGYETRYDQYDLMIDKVKPIVPRRLRFTVPERIDAKGAVIEPLDEVAVHALVPTLATAGIESVAVGFLHAYANPVHERRVEAILREALPTLSVTLASEVCPEVREYERFTTASVNAYVRPLMEGYLARLEGMLAETGIGCPMLLMTSGGGLTTVEAAKHQPVRLVESGPAGGVLLARDIAARAGLDKVMSFDMGGTTAKICFVENLEPRRAREFEVDRQARFMKGSGLPLRIPVIEMVEIGAGGGSIARVDRLGRIAVGPESAGAEPGPAGYGRGGTGATVTDADIVLGRIDPAGFAGGRIELRPELSATAVGRSVGEALDLGPLQAAQGIAEIVDENMSNAARVLAVEEGKVAAEQTIIAFGGAAPLHACRIAEKLGIGRIVIPVDAGVGSAVGFLRAPVAYEVVRSLNMRLSSLDAGAVNELMADMRREARAVVESGAFGAALTERRVAYMRYLGQGHEIAVAVAADHLEPGDGRILQAAYDQEYERLFKRTIPDADVEVLSWGLTVSTEEVMPVPDDRIDAPAAATPVAWRPIFDTQAGATAKVPLYRRSDLAAGDRLDGPALIVEEQTSTFVSSTFRAMLAPGGNIVLERRI
ncbi:MAG: hydantoinase/oxoprolinase family protein [Alphaproteobacteria bacterium]|nr:hydantoinase/oxoprolinase family protein [Alphaproteobacteria bacterium]